MNKNSPPIDHFNWPDQNFTGHFTISAVTRFIYVKVFIFSINENDLVGEVGNSIVKVLEF